MYTFALCPNLTSIEIPESVTLIEGWAFQECENLMSISIPNNVTEIQAGAFMNCYSLKTITLPDSIIYLSADMFMRCSKLSTINYRGTEEQWNALTKDTDWNSGCPSDMVINYNYGKLISKNLSDSVIATVNKTTLVISGSGKIPEKAYIDCTELTTLIINGIIPSNT